MLLAGLSAFMLTLCTGLTAAAENVKGDVTQDGKVNVMDIVRLYQHLHNIAPLAVLRTADMDNNNKVDVYDLALLKKTVLYGISTEPDPTEPDTTEPDTTESTPTEPDPTEPAPTESDTTEPTPTDPPTFMTPPAEMLLSSLPSQGDAELVVFYVDFPDCRYEYDPTMEKLTDICFGTDADPDGTQYPFNSMRSFYTTSSKGAMQLNGQVFRYTTAENRSAYDIDKDKLVRECYDAFNEQVDFSQFDGDGDGVIDATIFSVPTAAGDDYWWPCAGPVGDDNYRVDGKAVGHIITGNAQIESETEHKNFVSSYLHEMGHCMGLPDYYLYTSEDYEGLPGNGGTELMDTDAYSDFGCFSKLMLGWYRDDQVSVFDKANGSSQTFTLTNAQTDAGNCLILPCGDLEEHYFSEYMMLEFVTPDGLNSGIRRDLNYWQTVGTGVRVYHIRADFADNGWWTFLKYENGSEFTNGDDDGIRLIRMANWNEGGEVLQTGEMIDSSFSGFHWYAEDESESVDTGYTVTIGELTENGYTVYVTQN